MAEPAKAAQAAEAQEKDAGEGSSQDATGSECPFCVMMRKGGCEAPFKVGARCRCASRRPPAAARAPHQ